MSTTPQPLRIKATVITAAGERVTLAMVCPSRSDADSLIESTYPDARCVSVIVVRGAKPC